MYGAKLTLASSEFHDLGLSFCEKCATVHGGEGDEATKAKAKGFSLGERSERDVLRAVDGVETHAMQETLQFYTGSSRWSLSVDGCIALGALLARLITDVTESTSEMGVAELLHAVENKIGGNYADTINTMANSALLNFEQNKSVRQARYEKAELQFSCRLIAACSKATLVDKADVLLSTVTEAFAYEVLQMAANKVGQEKAEVVAAAMANCFVSVSISQGSTTKSADGILQGLFAEDNEFKLSEADFMTVLREFPSGVLEASDILAAIKNEWSLEQYSNQSKSVDVSEFIAALIKRAGNPCLVGKDHTDEDRGVLHSYLCACIVKYPPPDWSANGRNTQLWKHIVNERHIEYAVERDSEVAALAAKLEWCVYPECEFKIGKVSIYTLQVQQLTQIHVDTITDCCLSLSALGS
jgi:hypothetical protein